MILLSPNAFNLDQCKILLFGKDLMLSANASNLDQSKILLFGKVSASSDLLPASGVNLNLLGSLSDTSLVRI